jgi:hypothetical protein
MAWLTNLPGWREILLALILLIVIYMLWLVWRMRRIGRPPIPAPVRRDEPSWQGETRGEEGAPLIYTRPRRKLVSSPETGNAPSPDEGDAVRQNQALAQQAFMAGVERELLQMRDEMDALRGAFAALRSDMENVRDACEQAVQNLHTAQNASPLYSDAMQMAVLGHDAITIAERCGISRAEAELVVGLVKNKDTS